MNRWPQPVDEKPPCLPTLIDPDPEALARAFGRYAAITVGSVQGEKIGPPKRLEELCALSDYALIEADGARELPLKAPAAHEPVIPENALLVVAVAGVDGFGKPVSSVHRPELYAALIGKPLDAPVTPEDAAFVLCHPEGQKKNVRCKWSALLNQADDAEKQALARACAMRIPGGAVITSLIHEPTFETTVAIHSMRNTGWLSGCQGETVDAGVVSTCASRTSLTWVMRTSPLSYAAAATGPAR